MLPPIAAELKPGTIGRKTLSVADPEAGQQVNLPLMLARGRSDGPTLCLLSAQRGLDVNGSAAIQLLFPHLDLDDLKGVIVAAPFANPPAARTRRLAFPSDLHWPSGCPHDMNNVWPGDAEGTPTERMAAALWEECIEPSHAVIDFHSNPPQCGPSTTVRASSDAGVATARAFGVTHIRLTREIPESTLYDVAARQGKAALEVRLPPPGMIEPSSVRLALSGVRNVLPHLKMSSRDVRSAETALIPAEGETRVWHAPTDGIVLSHVDPGSIVQEGAMVAELISLHTAEAAAEVVAPFRGVVTLIGCAPERPDESGVDLVSQGEAYASVARCDL